MRLVHALGAAVAATALVGSVAKATLTATLVQIPVNSTAASAINSSKPVRTFQLRATQANNEQFDVGNLQVTLASGGNVSGYFYADPTVHSNTTGENKSYLNPGQTAASASFYDTYVTTPVFNATPTAATAADRLAVTGSADWPVSPGSLTPTVPQTTGNSVAGNQSMNIVWGDPRGTTAANPDGSYTIAQFTIVGNTGAFIKGYFGGSLAANVAQFFKPNNATGALATQLNGVNAANGGGGVVYLPILGDTNRDGSVGLTDLNNVENNFGGNNPAGDTNADGSVGLADLNNVENNFGNAIVYSAPPAGSGLGSVVPEPSMLSLGLAGLAVLARRGRRAAK